MLILEAMALQVSYRYKTQVTEESQRRLEGIKVKRKFPAKIPVSNGLRVVVACTVLYISVVSWGEEHVTNRDTPPIDE